jgi:hypothetical protein
MSGHCVLTTAENHYVGEWLRGLRHGRGVEKVVLLHFLRGVDGSDDTRRRISTGRSPAFGSMERDTAFVCSRRSHTVLRYHGSSTRTSTTPPSV